MLALSDSGSAGFDLTRLHSSSVRPGRRGVATMDEDRRHPSSCLSASDGRDRTQMPIPPRKVFLTHGSRAGCAPLGSLLAAQVLGEVGEPLVQLAGGQLGTRPLGSDGLALLELQVTVMSNRGNRMPDFWTIIFNILIHGILLGAMALFAFVLFRLAMDTYDVMERLKRILALFAGAMVVVGAQASGMNFAEFVAKALTTGRASSAAAAVISSLIAGLAGLGVGYLLVRLYRQSDVLAVRLICLVGMLALAAFLQSYATITSTNGVFVGAMAAPNIAFAAGLVLIFVFTDTDLQAPSTLGPGARLAQLFRRRPAQGIGQAEQSTPERGRGATRDPFDF